MRPAATSEHHRPEIDGLRAIAIIPVVLYHAELGFRAGFIGVDVFFTISGFLIAGIILRDLDAGNFSFANFWLRRVRRLLPALLALLAATLFIGSTVLFPTQFVGLADQVLSCLGLVANIKMHQILGWYWAPQAHTVPLLHIWSLAVEEQFYLITPVLLYATHRWAPQWIGPMLTAITLASIAAAWHFTHTDPGFNFYMLPTRAWELSIGCLGAWAIRRGIGFTGQYAIAATGTGVWMILYSISYLGDVRGWPNLWTLLPTIGTLLVLMCRERQAHNFVATRLLANPPLRFIGQISYSLYLWHWPIIVFVTAYKSPMALTKMDRCSIVALSVAAATLSWRFAEQPYRQLNRGPCVSTRTFLFGSGIAWSCVFGIAFWLTKTNRFENYFSQRLPPMAGG